MRLLLNLLLAGVLSLTACSQSLPKGPIGQQMPPLDVEYLDAAPDLKGKAMVVEFWATWCTPCIALIPHLNDIAKKYKAKGLEVVSITDEDAATIKAFRKKHPMEYNVALDKKQFAQGLGLVTLPHAFLVGKDGKILWAGSPVDLTDAVVEKAVK